MQILKKNLMNFQFSYINQNLTIILHFYLLKSVYPIYNHLNNVEIF
jgi:hypothetical protein